jgi:hypothetical protein
MLTAQIPDITPFIKNDRSAVRYYLVFAALVLMLGVLLAGLTFHPAFKNINAMQDLGQKVGGGFISTLSAFPIKEFLLRRDRLRILLALATMVSNIQLQPLASEDDIKRIYDLVWEIYKKATTG